MTAQEDPPGRADSGDLEPDDIDTNDPLVKRLREMGWSMADPELRERSLREFLDRIGWEE